MTGEHRIAEGSFVIHHDYPPAFWGDDVNPSDLIQAATVSAEITVPITDMETYRHVLYGADFGEDGPALATFTATTTTTTPDPLYHRPRDMTWRQALAWIRAVWRHRHRVVKLTTTIPNVRFNGLEVSGDTMTFGFHQVRP